LLCVIVVNVIWVIVMAPSYDLSSHQTLKQRELPGQCFKTI
jgi:hypothetical protein